MSLTWVFIPFISYLLLILILVYTFVGLACSCLFNTLKLQPRVVETRRHSHDTTNDNILLLQNSNKLEMFTKYNVNNILITESGYILKSLNS